MHIPDGYMSPLFTLGTGVITVPAWALASRRVQAVLNNRTVPLLAIFSAFSFAIMMFNIPVPGGTTAHGVGGTLLAIVLGPWAALIGVSLALIIQALFFSDGGILAIFTNCLNMGIILPFVGYWCYRAIAGNAPLLSTRRVWAAGIGAYIGITASALAVGFELGLQPLLFVKNGLPEYSPYDFSAAIPAMLISHLFGAALVEGLITALGIAYLQKQFPEYLTALRNVVAGSAAPVGRAASRPLWQVVAAVAGGGIVVLLVAGLISGGGDFGHLFGADWSTVDWSAVGVMLLITAIIAAILIPAAWLLLPQNIKRPGTFFVALAVLAPLGLITPGIAYGEGSTEDVHAAFGYVPKGLQDLSSFFSAPFADYNVPLPFFSGANSALWHQAIGYEITGIVGFALIGLAVWGLSVLMRRGNSEPAAPTPAPRTRDAKS